MILNEKRPKKYNICKLSIDQEKLQLQIFQGKPESSLLRKKSEIENTVLIKKIDEIFLSQKFPTNNIGNEKKRDKNRGISIRLKGIRNLKESSKVKEYAIQ